MAKQKYTAPLNIMVEPEMKAEVARAAHGADQKVAVWVRRAITQRLEREQREQQLMGA